MKRDLFKTLPGPENTLKREFPNGVTVLIQENPGSSTAAICGSLFAGSCLEDPDKYGLSAFVSAALTGGTRSRPLFLSAAPRIGSGLRGTASAKI